jgi:hypothetical protein
MGMSTSLTGFRPPDDDFKKMLAAYRACEAAGIAVPDKVMAFFNGERPDEAGVAVNLSPYREDHMPPFVKRINSEVGGFEVDLDLLRRSDPTIKVLRFKNSW